jgi:hypothetical protein
MTKMKEKEKEKKRVSLCVKPETILAYGVYHKYCNLNIVILFT